MLVLALVLGDCAGEKPSPVPYRPTRQDYAAFAEAWPELLEPNYLPFMVHRVPGDDAAGDLLFFCRWPDDAMPIPVWVTPARIPGSLQDEFSPRDPELYARAARRALATWERELEGLVRFQQVETAGEARLTLRLVGERAPEPDPERKVLGTTKLADACRVGGLDPDAERLDVGFEVAELELYLADEFGLLAPDQVEWIALHEIGHALGMRGHSPIPADLMYEVARDRVTVHEGLSPEDVNSFVSLYQIPNGTIFARALEDPDPPPPPAPGPPQLALAPHVDTRLGFSLRPPAGWTRLSTAQGMAAVHGTTWDYVASFQVVVHRFDTVEDYVERYGDYYAQRGRVTPPVRLAVNGHRALQVEIDRFDAPRVEQITAVESGDGRLVVLIGDCPREAIDAYRPWFRSSLGSLRISALPEEAWPARRREP